VNFKKLSKLEIDLSRIKEVDILLFTKQLSITLQSGLTLPESLRILAEQAKGRMKKMLQSIVDTVESGAAFSDAIQKYPKHFSVLYINTVKAGEVSGALPVNLLRLALQLKKKIELQKKVKSALIYPGIIFIAVFIMGFVVALFVLPKIIPLFESLDVELPLTTKILIWVAEFSRDHGLLSAIAFILTGNFSFWLFRQEFVKPFTHKMALYIPVLKNIIINLSLENFTRTLGSLLKNGLTVDQSLKITAESTGNVVYRKTILKLIPQIEGGSSISTVIASEPKLFPIIATKMISVGERTGKMDQTLEYLADYYEAEVNELTKNLSTVIEPFMMIIIGGIVGVIAISILGPIYSITSGI